MASPNPSQTSPRPSNENVRGAAAAMKQNRSAASDPESVSDQMEAIRADIQTLTKTVGDVAAKQWSDARTSAEDHVRRNPLAAVAIAAGLGFLYAMIRR